MGTKLSAWERKYYGDRADIEEKRRQAAEENRKKAEEEARQRATRLHVDFNDYTSAMKTRTGAQALRERERQQDAILRPEAQRTTSHVQRLQAPEASMSKPPVYATPASALQDAAARAVKAGKAVMPSISTAFGPRVSREEMARAYAAKQQEIAQRNMAAGPARISREQAAAATDWQAWQEEVAAQAGRSGMSVDEYMAANPQVQQEQDEMLRAAGLTSMPDADALARAAQAGNAAAKDSARQEYRDNTGKVEMYRRYLSQVDELAARNDQTVEEYLQGDGKAYAQLLAEDPELQEAKQLYDTQQQGGSISPALDAIQQRNLDRYQGAETVMESAEMIALLDQGRKGEWMAAWNRAYTQAADAYTQKAEALQQMRMSGQASDSALDTAMSELDALQTELDNLRAVQVMGRADFEEKSQTDAVLSARDANYWAVNHPAESRDLTVDERTDMPSVLNAGWVNDTERRIYNYLYATEGQKRATAYLESLGNRLQYRKAVAEEESARADAQANPILANAASLAASVLEAPAAIGTTAAAMTGQDVNPYGAAFAPTRFKTAVRGETDAGISNPLLKLAYNAGMSMGDNLIALGTSGGLALLASMQMGASAYGATAYDTLIRGGSSQDAALSGGAAALTEYLTERMGFDRITRSWTMGTNTLGYKGALAQFVKGFIPEGLEEVPGNYVDAAVDGWLMGGNSKRNQRISALMGSGMKLDDAMSQADAEFVGETVMSFLAGGLAGGMMTGGSYVGGVHQGKTAARADAKAIATELGVDQKTQQKALEMEYGVRNADQEVLDQAQAQIEEAAEAQGRAVTKAAATLDGAAVKVTGIKSTGAQAEITVLQEDGTEATTTLDAVDFQTPAVMGVYEEAARYEDAETAQQFLQGFESSRDTLDNYRKGFEAAYTAGYTNRPLEGSAKTWAQALRTDVYNAAYKAGKRAQQAMEARLDMDEDVSNTVRRAVAQMPREIMEGYTGAVNRVTGRLTSFQASQMAVADYLGKKFGVVYTFVDSSTDITGKSSIASEGVQGAYTAGSNRVVIAIGAQEGALLSVAGHETLHYVKEWAGKNDTTRAMYDDFQTFVLDRLQAVEGYDLETRIAEKQDQYRRAGQQLDREGAIEEIVADGMTAVFATDQNVQEFLESHDQTMVEKVVSTVKRLVKEIKAAIQRIARNNAEAAAMMQQDADTLQEISERFERLAVGAYGVRLATDEMVESSGDARFSIKELPDGRKYVDVDTDQHIFDNATGYDIRKIAHEYIKKHFRGKVIGTVNRAFVRNESERKYLYPNKTPDKTILESLWKASPELASMMDASEYIDFFEDSEEHNHGEDTYGFDKYRTLFHIDGVWIEGVLNVKVTKTGDIFYGISKTKSIAVSPTVPTLIKQSNRTHSNASDISIPDSAENSNPSQKFSLSNQTETSEFRRWFGNSVVVNEDGSPKVMYHGTPYGDFTVFKDWQYFTEDQAYADVYQNPSASSIRGRYNPATNPKTYGVYLRVEKPFDTRNPKIRKLWEEEFFNQYSRTPLSEKNLPDWTDGIDLIDFIEENDYDFDAIILDEGAVGGYGDEVQSRGVSIVVRNPTQIKSATDNVGTFDADNPDIRYSISDQRETQESARSVYEQYRAASNRLQEVQEAERRLTTSDEFLDVMDLLNKDPAAGAKAYRELLKKHGLDKGGSASIQKEVNSLYQRYQKLEREEAAKREQSAIEKSGKSAADWHRNEAVKAFGYTPYYVDAGYMLPNGKMLNFSGEKGKHFGERGDDHRAIGQVFENMSGSEAMIAFMHEGNIRMMPESPGIDIAASVKPTAQQYSAIRKFAAEYGSKGSFSVDFTDENGREAGSLVYNGRVRPERVVNDIRHYFDTGEIRSQGASEFLYSLRDVDAANDEMARLLQENGELRGLVNQLSAQLKGRNGAMPDPSAVRQLARRFKEDSGTRVPLKTLTENLQTAYAAMANAQSTAESQAAMEMMGSIAQDMLEKSAYANRELYDQYEEMRKYFKGGIGLTSKQWQEVKKVYGSNKAFRQATARHLKVRAEGSGGVTLDNKWGELCERWPAFFQEDTNEGDQVEAVLAALEAVQITYENPYGDSLNDYANDMAMLMYQEYMAIPEVKDGKTRQIEKLTTQLDEARATIRRQAAQVRKVGRLETRIQEYRDAARGRYQRQAQRRKDNQDYSKMRAQVIRQRDQLMRKLLEPKVGAFVPQGMHDAVMELIRSIDFEGRLEGFTDKRQRRVLRAESINRAKDEYLAMARPDAENARGPFAAFVNGDLEGEFDLLAKEADGLAARDLSMRQMEALRNIVAGYSAAVVNADRLFMQDRRDSLSTVGNEMAAGMLTRRERMKQGKAAEWLRSATSKGLLKPVTVFHQFKGTPMEKVWKALRNAENIHIRHVSEAEEYLQAALRDYQQQESIRLEGGHTKRSKAVDITLDDGRKMKLTDQELMTLYAVFKREQKVGTNHLLGGGFTLANAPRGSSTAPVHITGPTLQEILDRHLTQEQKAYVDHMVEYLSTTCADWGNEVTLQLYGVEKFHEDYYIPFTVNKNYVAQEPAAEQDSRLKTGSFTKALTPQASTPLEIRPFTELWCEHVEKMSDYNAFVLPIEDMTRLMNYKTDGESIRALMKRHYSPETANYIMNFLSRLNGNSRSEAGGSWLNAFMGKAKAAAVTFNASVAIQQMGSASRAMAMIDPKYFIGGSAAALFHKGSISSSYKELEQYAPIAILKSWGYFDTNMARGLYTRAQSKRMDKLSDWGGKLAELGDRATWARIWEAVKLEISDTTDLEKGSEAYYQACADRFTEVIDGTQVVDSVFQRAEWATEKGLMKQQMSFMSEPLTMYNMLYRAGWDIANAGDSKAARHRAQLRFGRTLAAVTLSSAVTAALKSVVSALRDRDNEKKDEEGNIIGVRTGLDKWLDALGGNFLENMLGIGSIFTNMVQGAFSYYSSDLTTQWLSDLVDVFKELQKGKDADVEKTIYKLARSLSSLTGFGFGNAVRDITSIHHAIDEAVNRDLLAGSAWDTSLPFETRLAAAEKNYVMKKQGDKRKVNTGIYYDLMLAAYFESGLGEDYQAVLDAAIRTGGSETMWQTFKKHLRVAETRLPGAAQALLDGDMATYSRLYNELLEGGIGERAVASMIISEVEALSSEDEEDVPANSNYIIGQLQRSDVDTDPVAKKLNMDYNAAVDAENPQKLKAAIDAMRKNGMAEKDLRTKVSTSYKKAYCWAVWNGETKVSTHAATMMKGAGVGIDNDDLKAWTSSLSGDDSYGSDQLYKLLREGNGKQAHVIHKYLISANSSDAMEKKLKNWCRQHVKGKDDEKNVRAALKQMGYAQSTIDSWFQ